LLSYALKRIVRSWKLFAALILGMMLAGTFFGGINVGADTVGKQALDQQLRHTVVDIRLETVPYYYGPPGASVRASAYESAAAAVRTIQGVSLAETRGNSGTGSFNISTGSIRAIPDGSLLYQHMAITSGRQPQSANETIVNVGSEIANEYPLNTTLTYQLSTDPTQANFTITLTIVGKAVLDPTAGQILGTGVYYDSTDIVTPSVQYSVLD